MAIEIIYRGKAPSEINYTCTCETCHSVLRFKSQDVKDIPDYRETGYMLNCPVCKKDVYLSKLTKYVSNIDPY